MLAASPAGKLAKEKVMLVLLTNIVAPAVLCHVQASTRAVQSVQSGLSSRKKRGGYIGAVGS
eukprot:scaffold147311_cov22-Tisochrysis_lutea.AAC.1